VWTMAEDCSYKTIRRWAETNAASKGGGRVSKTASGEFCRCSRGLEKKSRREERKREAEKKGEKLIGREQRFGAAQKHEATEPSGLEVVKGKAGESRRFQ